MQNKSEGDALSSACEQQHVFIDQLDSNIYYSLIQKPVRIDVPQKTGYFNIVLFEEGNGVIKIDGQSYEIQKSKVFVLLPGQYGSGNILRGTVAHHLMARTEVYHSISSVTSFPIGKLKLTPELNLSRKIFDNLRDEIIKIKDILAESSGNYSENEDVVINRLKTIYLMLKAECMNIRNLEVFDVTHPAVDKFVQLVEENFRTYKNVNFYAEQIHIQSNYLNILCKSVLKVSAKQLIKNRIIEEAKILLLSSNKSVKQISFELGTINSNQFSLFFKKETGLSPKEFFKLRKLETLA
ncbi:AraC family transcriptional regulator [Sphingobacterium multivorum]|uniref:AraC family transcriptional regulator n=1 Tax=Sphingobacterium multivorum TaxID=28454 RepID=UPI0031BB077B